MKRQLLVGVTALFVLIPAFSEDPLVIRNESDQNGDGRIDYILDQNENDEKVYEALDYNNDGLLDDFYFYENGILRRHEVDSNYDGKVDTWVFISEGIYMRRFERDLDYDGVVDLVRDYEEPVE